MNRAGQVDTCKDSQNGGVDADVDDGSNLGKISEDDDEAYKQRRMSQEHVAGHIHIAF